MPEMLIPRIFHRFWIGRPMPERFVEYGKTWERHHPGWTMRLWDDQSVRPLINQHGYDSERNLAIKADVARYEILLRHGGVYIDTDFECFKNLEPLLAGVTACAAYEQQGATIANGLIASVPQHPFIAELVRRVGLLLPRDPQSGIKTGPALMRRVFNDLGPESLTVLPQKFIYPFIWTTPEPDDIQAEFPEAYAAHHYVGSRLLRGWKD